MQARKLVERAKTSSLLWETYGSTSAKDQRSYLSQTLSAIPTVAFPWHNTYRRRSLVFSTLAFYLERRSTCIA